jgi:hypothetical protein
MTIKLFYLQFKLNCNDYNVDSEIFKTMYKQGFNHFKTKI